MRSIRLFLLAATLAVVCLGNFLAALNGYYGSLETARNLLDNELLEQQHVVQQLLRTGTNPPSHLLDENQLYQVVRGNSLLFHSFNAPGYFAVANQPGFHFVSYRGSRWRLLVQTPDSARHGLSIITGRQYDEYLQLTNNLLLQAIRPLLWIMPALAAVILLIITLGLNPLKNIATALRQRRATDFTPLPTESLPRELWVVVHSINSMQQRLQTAFENEQQFSADAAHELRTPITAMGVACHNLAPVLAGNAEAEQSLQILQRSTDNMANIIDQLLSLYRLSSGDFAAKLTIVALDELIRDEIIAHYDQLEARDQHIEFESSAVLIRGDQFALALMFSNLLRNASRHTPRGSEIRVRLEPVNEQARIIIEDSGPGIPLSERSRVFDRFYRGRQRVTTAGTTSGSGLGLAIVNRIVGLHQGSIFLDHSEALGGLAIVIALPAFTDESLRYLE